MAAWAVLGPYWDRKREFRVQGGEDAARNVPVGAWGSYAGARWRVLEVSSVPRDKLPEQVQLPANGQVLTLRLEVNPGPDGAGQNNVSRCKLVLRDGRGRGWQGDPDALRLYARMLKYPMDCARPRQGPHVGPYTVHQLFLLPDDAAIADLRLELQLFPPPQSEPTGVYLDMQLAGGR